MSGNPNLSTIIGVTYLANKKYRNENKKIEKVLFIDTTKSLDPRRSEFIKKCICRSVSIEAIELKIEEFHQNIPKLISEQLKLYPRSEIIVDLTNGTKYVSSILYASASMAKIENLFFLDTPREIVQTFPSVESDDSDSIKKIEDFLKNNYKEEFISIYKPLENLDSLEKYNHFEIIYYGEEAKRLVEIIERLELGNELFKETIGSHLNSAIDDYFNGKYGNSIRTLGLIVEHLTKEIARKLKDLPDPDLKKEIKNKSGIKAIEPFCNDIRNKIKDGKNLKEYQEKLKSLRGLDHVINATKFYRNDNSHISLTYIPPSTKEESRLVLINTLYFLDLISSSSLLQKNLETKSTLEPEVQFFEINENIIPYGR